MKKIFVIILLFFNCSNSTSGPENVSYNVITMPSETSNNTMDAELIDLNGDGFMDIVLAMEFRRNIALISDGKGNFAPKTDVFTNISNDSEDISIADFNKDGHLDIVIVSEDNQLNEYYRNKGDGSFEDITHQFPVTKTTNGMDIADIDKDGDIDILLGNAGQNTLLINDGNGNFTDETETRLELSNETTQDVEFGDVDSDGDLDVVLGNETDNFLYINDGSGHFSIKSVPLPSQIIEETREADFGDIDGDGDLDIFFANVVFNPPSGKTYKNRILINDGIGNFIDESDTRFLAQNNNHSVDGDFVDIDKDGDLDLIIANAFGGSHQIVLNSNGIFNDRTSDYFKDTLTDGIDALVHDFNNDGHLDIYFTVFRGSDKLILSRK